jgi:multiple sugar transport system substrate-binding protein
MGPRHSGGGIAAVTGRRGVLQLGGATLAATALQGVFAPGAWGQTPAEIVFATGPDDSGTVRALVDAFNEEHEGQVRVSWQEMAQDTDAYRRQLVSDFLVGAAEIDVIAADVIWTAEFAGRGWVRDLSSWFYGAYEPEAFLDAALNSTAYRNRIWGIPWYTDAGMLFYRRDLLDATGFDGPPATWNELKEMALRVRQDSGVSYGFVFQGAEYEGGVANALEYVWSAGGSVLAPGISIAGAFGERLIETASVVINSPQSVEGLAIARGMITDGAAPEEVTTFREEESLQAFIRGEAVFMRNWPYAYGLLDDPQRSALTPDQVGVAPIPKAVASERSYSCLGGWNLMISRASRNADAAWAFIRYATSPERQRRRALEGGFLPTLGTLYEDGEILDQVPAVALGREAVATARVRPISPRYHEMSPRIARAFNLTLRGDLDSREALERLDRELRTIVGRDA